MSKPCPRILELIKGQKYTCSAVIVKRKPLVTQYRELKAKYGMDKWVVVEKGTCRNLGNYMMHIIPSCPVGLSSMISVRTVTIVYYIWASKVSSNE